MMQVAITIAAFLIATSGAMATDLPPAGKDLGAVTGGEFTSKQVLDTKCLTCHNRQVIDNALKQHKDMEAITKSMENKGVRLTDKERSSLNIFWSQNPYKNK
jgi:hypothetical protein